MMDHREATSSAPVRTFRAADHTAPLRIGVIIGRGGRTLLNLARCIERDGIPARIVSVLAPRADLAGVEKARAAGFDVTIMPPALPHPEETHDFITRFMLDAEAEIIALAGYLRWFRLDPPYVGRVVNIHPALLPAFGGRGMYGRHVHEAVLAYGAKVSGCTIHFVDDEYDHGPVILQRTCDVRDDDSPETLAARVFAEECLAFPDAIARIASGRLVCTGRQVHLREE